MYTCPICNGVLIDQTGLVDPDVAPFLCDPCCRSWWLVELTSMVRTAFDPATRSVWGEQAQELIQVGALAEIEQAQARAELNSGG